MEPTSAEYRILAIHAHPDDIEILAAGTLALLKDRGHHITIITMTAGDCGTAEYSPDEISRIRQLEAEKSAALLGADYFCAGFKDLSIFQDDRSRRKVTELLRQTRPDIIITAAPADYHCDHEATSALVRDACFAAPAPNYKAGSLPPIQAIPHLYFADPDEGMDREGRPVMPEFLINIASKFELKRSMLACHDSQRVWLQKHHHMDNYLETMEEWTAARGRLGGVRYAEGFRQYGCHPYPRAPLLQQLLKDALLPVRNTSAA